MFTFRGNRETIIVYAWLCSQEALRSAVRLKDLEQWQRHGREKIIEQLMQAEAGKVDAASFYEPLLRYGIARVDPDTIRATIDESGSILRKEDDAEDQGTHAHAVTALLLQSIEHATRLHYNLELLCQPWEKGDLVEAASALRAFFLAHAHLCLRSPDLAFFVPEVVCVQLHQVRWIEIAARVLARALPTLLPPLEEIAKYAQHEALQLALLEEIIWQVGAECKMLSRLPHLPDGVGEHLSALGIRCRGMAHMLSVQRTLAICSAPPEQVEP